MATASRNVSGYRLGGKLAVLGYVIDEKIDRRREAHFARRPDVTGEAVQLTVLES